MIYTRKYPPHSVCGFPRCPWEERPKVITIPTAFSWACFSLTGSGKIDTGPVYVLRALSSRCSRELLPTLWGPGWTVLLPPHLLWSGHLLQGLAGVLPGDHTLFRLHDGRQGLRGAAPHVEHPDQRHLQVGSHGASCWGLSLGWLGGAPRTEDRDSFLHRFPREVKGPGLGDDQPTLLLPLPPTGLRRVSRPLATWTTLDVCTVCHPCFTKRAAFPSRSLWTMANPSRALAPGWPVSPTLLG